MEASGAGAAPAVSRVWSMDHQQAFAHATGDVNPMHMDARVGRRTLAGGAAVHGVHAALWALDACAASHAFERLSAVQMRFERFIRVGDRAEIAVHEADGDRLRLSVSVEGLRAVTIQAAFAPDRPRGEPGGEPVSVAAGAIPDDPVVVEPSDLAGLTGAFGLRDPAGAAALAPHLARAIGPGRVAAFGGLSTLVGMIVPGLHSILSKIDVTLVDEAGGPTLAYAVKRFQPLLQAVTAQASGPGVEARVESFVRPRPVEPESLRALAALVRPGEFSDVSALVIGGSRGLGAATAMLLAAGGGDVCITYASGADEAEAVAREIRADGGRCQVLPYDAERPAGPQFRSLALKPSQLYHFATPRIFRQKHAPFEPWCFEEMMRIYNYAFHDLCLHFCADNDRLSVLYPSTVAIDEAPRDAVEYVMAKTAGEVLAATMARTIPNLRVRIERLPRVKTDQTATIFPVPAAPPSQVMLPIVRRLSGR